MDKNYIIKLLDKKYNSNKPYKDNLTFKEYYDYKVYLNTFGKLSDFTLSKNLIKRELLFILNNDNCSYIHGNELFFIDNVLESWINLLREWYKIVYDKNNFTKLYYAKVKYHTDFYKIGITKDLYKREYEFPNNRYYDYKLIKEYDNRFCCAYVEYKLRTLYCYNNSEIISKDTLDKVINYVNSLKYTKKIKEEVSILGWQFNNTSKLLDNIYKNIIFVD